MSAEVHAVDGELQFGAPRTLLSVQLKTPAFGWLYVSPDGNRFLMAVVTTTTEPSITVLVNGPVLLKK
jgi:hypothetical protein